MCCKRLNVLVQEVEACRREFVFKHGDFLLPPGYPGHAHEWVGTPQTGIQFCGMCGKEHVCFRGQCPEESNSAGELVCTITGCVTRMLMLYNEKNAYERTFLSSRGGGQQLHQNNNNNNSDGEGDEPGKSRYATGHNKRQCPASNKESSCESAAPAAVGARSDQVQALFDTVKFVVSELLDSSKTRACFEEEERRSNLKAGVILGRLLRELNARGRFRPNMIEIESYLSHAVNRTRDRQTVLMTRQQIQIIMKICVENIVAVIQTHGWLRTQRQMQNPVRAREFVCSMLYLMRTGVTFQNRSILIKEERLNMVLPLQVFLPKMFKIRAKCITEGENILKLDLCRFPMR